MEVDNVVMNSMIANYVTVDGVVVMDNTGSTLVCQGLGYKQYMIMIIMIVIIMTMIQTWQQL